MSVRFDTVLVPIPGINTQIRLVRATFYRNGEIVNQRVRINGEWTSDKVTSNEFTIALDELYRCKGGVTDE